MEYPVRRYIYRIVLRDEISIRYSKFKGAKKRDILILDFFIFRFFFSPILETIKYCDINKEITRILIY